VPQSTVLDANGLFANGRSGETKMKHHYHKNEQGLWERCYHQTKYLFSPAFLAGFVVANTIAFPLEHALWARVRPFSDISEWIGEAVVSWEASIVIVVLWLVIVAIALYFSVRGE